MTTDEELVRLALEGNQTAYTELYARLLPRMRKVANDFLRWGPDADDVPHDIIVHIFARLKGFRSESKFSTWATTVGMNYACSRLRRTKSTLRIPAGGMVYLDAGEPGAIQLANRERGYSQTDARADVEQVLCRLPAGYRNVLKARFLGEMSHEEVSAMYGISVGGSKSQMSKGLRKARQLMEAQG